MENYLHSIHTLAATVMAHGDRGVGGAWSAHGVTVTRTKPQKSFFNLSTITVKTQEWSATILETERYGVKLLHVIESDGMPKDIPENSWFDEEALRKYEAIFCRQ